MLDSTPRRKRLKASVCGGGGRNACVCACVKVSDNRNREAEVGQMTKADFPFHRKYQDQEDRDMTLSGTHVLSSVWLCGSCNVVEDSTRDLLRHMWKSAP